MCCCSPPQPLFLAASLSYLCGISLDACSACASDWPWFVRKAMGVVVSRSLLDESVCRRLEGMATLILVLSCFESFSCFTITSSIPGVPWPLLCLMTSSNLCLAFCTVLPCSLALRSATVLSQALLSHPCCCCHLQFLLLRCTSLSAGAPASLRTPAFPHWSLLCLSFRLVLVRAEGYGS